MYIDQMYKANPELTKNMILNLLGVEGLMELRFHKQFGEKLVFQLIDPKDIEIDYVSVDDFSISASNGFTKGLDLLYQKVMAGILGEEYVDAYVAQREKEKAEMNNEFDAITIITKNDLLESAKSQVKSSTSESEKI